jgi:hypothetical protein
MIDHVVRRSLESTSTLNFIKRAANEGPAVEIPGWGIFVLVASVVAITVFLSLVTLTHNSSPRDHQLT